MVAGEVGEGCQDGGGVPACSGEAGVQGAGDGFDEGGGSDRVGQRVLCPRAAVRHRPAHPHPHRRHHRLPEPKRPARNLLKELLASIQGCRLPQASTTNAEEPGLPGPSGAWPSRVARSE